VLLITLQLWGNNEDVLNFFDLKFRTIDSSGETIQLPAEKKMAVSLSLLTRGST